MKPRIRAAHLGKFNHQGRTFKATFKAGKLYFRPHYGHKAHAFTLSELYALAAGQRLLGI